MKRIIFTFSLGLLLATVYGQQKEGRVVYEHTVQIQIKMQGMTDEMERMIPHSRTDKLEVLFGNNQSLRRTVQDERPDDNAEGGGMQIRMMGAGTNDITYVNFAGNKVVEQREFAAKNYLIADSVHPLSWKLTGETSTVLNYPCQK